MKISLDRRWAESVDRYPLPSVPITIGFKYFGVHARTVPRYRRGSKGDALSRNLLGISCDQFTFAT